jgi:hypothetical protein
MPDSHPQTSLLVVIGDVHGNIPLALQGLDAIESEHGRAIDQVFSIGDFGLFLSVEDWRLLTGPHKHRHPELTPKIREAWQAWRWPLAMIGGNHEPWNKLRDFKADDFGPLLSFTTAGAVSHQVPGLKVYGLSGIFHPEHLEFHPPGDRVPAASHARNWTDFLRLVETTGKISPKRLTYYKQQELDLLLDLPSAPHLFLSHDWPKHPADARISYSVRPEQELVELLQPAFACCGHHHRAEAFRVGDTECRALSIIQDAAPSLSRSIRPGWAWLCEWEPTPGALVEIGYWPPLSEPATGQG